MPQYIEGQCIISKIERANRALEVSVAHIVQSDQDEPLCNVLFTLSKAGIGLYELPTDERPQDPFIAMVFPPGLGLAYRHLSLALNDAMIMNLQGAIAFILLFEEVNDDTFQLHTDLFDKTLKMLGDAVIAAASVKH